MSGRGKSTPLTPEEEARRVERTSDFRNRQLLVETTLGAPGLFFLNCGRCGTDINGDAHVASSTTDEDGKLHVTYYGVYCRQEGRPKNPQAREEAAEKGHEAWMSVTEDVMARYCAATGASRGVATDGMEITLDVDEELGEKEEELEEERRKLAAALGDLANLRADSARKLGELEKEVALARKECEEIGTSLKVELEAAKGEVQSLKVQLGKVAVEKSSLQEMYSGTLLKMKELETRLAGEDPLAFMSSKRAATGSAAAASASAAPAKKAGPTVSFSSEAETTYASAAAMGDAGASLGGASGGVSAGSGGTAEAFWGRSSADASGPTAPRGSTPGRGPTSDPSTTGYAGGTPIIPPRSTSRGPDLTVREEEKNMKTLMSSTKLIKGVLKSGKGIVEFMCEADKLRENIEEFFGRETEDTKIKIALLHMDDDVRTDADQVYRDLRVMGIYDLNGFMSGLFSLNYPSPWSSLDLAFRGLRQGDLSIIDYARRFKLFVGKLELNLKGQVNKFMLGLKDPGLRSNLYKQNLEVLDFDGIVRWAVTLSNNLKLERGSGAGLAVSACKEFDLSEVSLAVGDVEEDSAYKIMGIPLNVYLKAAEAKGVSQKCFNCFGTGHGSVECGLKICKFCEKNPKSVKHYSLMCPKAPRNLQKFLEEREKYKQKREAEKSKVCISDDFTDYTFESDELSD